MRDGMVLAAIAALALLRGALAGLRWRLYRVHRDSYKATDPGLVREGWQAALADGARWGMSWLAGLGLSVGLAFVVLYHPRTPRGLRDGVGGCLLYWLLGRACVEAYYLLNRRFVLARLVDARRTARRFPRSGLMLELMIVVFVGTPVALAAAVERTWFLIGGSAALGAQTAAALWRLWAVGRRLAGPPGPDATAC